MKNFLIIVNALKDKGLTETKKLCDYIQLKGGVCTYAVSVDAQEGVQKLNAGHIPPKTECILALGGDGTLIRAARDTVSCGVPLIGINMGTLGYLCELELDSVYDALDRIMADAYMTEERMMLSGSVMKYAPAENAGRPPTGMEMRRALNDIVIHRTGALSLVSLTVYVNGEYLNTFKGDGMILSTPTGSTGYNLSAGGPIVDPKAQLIVLTPINPHSLSAKSIVVSAQDEIAIEVGTRRIQRDERVEVSFDGDSGFRLEVGDRILVKRADTSAKILKLSRISFLEILRKKMQTYQ